MNKILSSIRELIWPLLEPIEKKDSKQIKEEDHSWMDADQELMIEYVVKYHESEELRKKEVESKSTILIGTFGVAATILIYLAKDLVLDNYENISFFSLTLVSLMTLSVVYLCRAIWFSIKVLERQNYYRVTFPNYMLENNIDKRKKLIIDYYNYTNKNTIVINLKVDFMTMAQEYFKRVVFLVPIFSILIWVKYISSSKIILMERIFSFKSISIESLLYIINISIVILFTLIVLIFRKLSRLSNR